MARNVWKNGDKLRFHFSSCKFVLEVWCLDVSVGIIGWMDWKFSDFPDFIGCREEMDF